MRRVVPMVLPGTFSRRTRRGWLSCAMRLMCGIVLSQSLGCASSTAIMPLEIRQGPTILAKTLPEAERLKVAVVPFEDRRTDTTRIGTRIHRLGGHTALTVEGNRLGVIIAEVVVEYLKRSLGWQAWVITPGALQPDADLTITGTIRMFEAKAVPKFGRTTLTVTARMHTSAQETAGRRSVMETIDETASELVWWFEPRDLEVLINSTIRKHVERLSLQLHDNGLVRP